MHEIFDDFIWTKQKKIITKNKHGVPGLGNVSYFNNNSASPPMLMHYHSDIIEIHCFFTGNYNAYIEKGGSITTYAITGNQVFITFPFKLHGNGTQPMAPSEFFTFQIAIDKQSQVLGLNMERSRKLVSQLMQLPNRQIQLEPASMSLVRNAYTYFNQLTPDSYVIGSRYISCFLFGIQYFQSVTNKTVRQTDRRIKKAIDYMNINIKERIQLADLADASGYSLSHFKMKFREEIGITPAEYVIMQKVDMAKKMLIESDVSITDVAFSLGFSSSNYFCTVFKKIRRAVRRATFGRIIDIYYKQSGLGK